MIDFSIEQQYSNHVIAGIDEVGRGSWAGPLVVGAAIISKDTNLESINDSKKLLKHKREQLSDVLWQKHICAIGQASVDEIDTLGLTQATYIAIIRAIESLPLKPTLLLIDGNYKFSFPMEHINVVKGDEKFPSIAAASIIAKVFRDNLMQELSNDFEHYSWNKNVGYGTKTHIDALCKYGPTIHHRKNYKPIRELLSLA